jgi:hypothetical protein
VLGSNLARARWRLLLSSHRVSLPPLQRDSMLSLAPHEVLILEMC